MKFLTIALLAVNAVTALAAPSPNILARDGGAGKPYVRLNKDDAALLVIDHQTGLTNLVRDIDPATFRQNVLAFSDMGKYFKLPTIITASRDDGPNGPIIPEILADHPNATIIRRPGEINAWDNADFVAAVKATGKKQLIMAGIVTEVCVAFPALSAIEAGYEVFVVTDASGTFNELVRQASWSRMEGAGVQLLSYFSAASELARDWRTDLQGLAVFFASHMPDFNSLILSYNGAVEAAKSSA